MARNSYTQLLRLVSIFSLLKRNRYTTKLQIRDKVFDKFGEVSDRTIDRDIEELRNEFGLVINYKRPDGYYIDNDSYQDIEKIENTLHLINSTLFKIKHSEKNSFIQSDTSIDAKGNEFLEDFHSAISSNIKVKIRYNSFIKEAYNLVINPYILKEYRQRWYVAAYNEKHERRIYSLDRIEVLELLKDEIQDKGLDKSDLFKDLIGVSLAYNKAEKVILKFDSLLSNYIKTRALHHSQETVEDKPGRLTIQLHLVVNWELEELIRGYGSSVEVLKPDTLRESVKQGLKKASEQYSK